ncbi:zinc finger protein 90-like [Uranotaenia lowii]|uniref:zinc finger protein 90-like n=1 Tax=Uranotaenia lowii TaxID=190385 RepID=UPI00247A29EB|nr:zinc finger protein 90-like [Uranotaenia lowii]
MSLVAEEKSLSLAESTSAGSQMLKCPFCDKWFSTFNSLHKHNAIVHTRKKLEFGCGECGKHFATKRYLEDHCSIEHIREPRYACQTCGKTFFRYHLYRPHCRNVHPEEYARLLTVYGAPRNIPFNELYSMDGCVFLKSNAIDEHEDKTVTESMELDCLICLKKCNSAETFDDHVAESHKDSVKLSCIKCSKTFDKKSLLEDHYAVKHLGMYRYECEICGHGFIKKKPYITHFKLRHPEEYANLVKKNKTHTISYKRYNSRCVMCDITFPKQTDLYAHMLTLHLSLTHSCKRCNESFACTSGLENHMTERHIGEPWYECEICRTKLYSKFDYFMHYETDHPKDYSELIQNNVCNELHDIDGCVVVERVPLIVNEL